jgi:DNA polymerase-3 subunit epsilon
MILFFDTETTGFPHKHKPVDHPDQPHLVQLAAELCEEDGRTVSSFSFIIDPGVCKGVRIPSGAAAVHGIDEERCWRVGVEPKQALETFDMLYTRADRIVGHNVDFDVEIMTTAFNRVAIYDSENDDQSWNPPVRRRELIAPRFCTMKSSTDICCIPSPKGGNKWPKLAEAYKHFTGLDLVGAHDAMNDLLACKAVFFKLREMGVV